MRIASSVGYSVLSAVKYLRSQGPLDRAIGEIILKIIHRHMPTVCEPKVIQDS